MIVRKAYQFRLRPTKKQARLLEMHLNSCRWLYNELLSQRKLAYEELELPLTKYQQLMFLPELKLEKPELDHIHSQVLQNVVDRLDKAFQGFFRRCKIGEKPGFPRFRGLHRYNSFCFPFLSFYKLLYYFTNNEVESELTTSFLLPFFYLNLFALSSIFLR
jgi:putative transposase